MSAARRVLERLLRRAESARARGADEHVSLPMGSRASAAEYLALQTLDELETFHGQIALAERDGAIAVVRDRHHADGRRLLKLQVADLGSLAKHMGVRSLDECCAEADACLRDWLPRFPVLASVLESWRQGRKVRGCGPEDAANLAAAAHLVATRAQDVDRERVLRRESARVFGDSKRIEQLSAWLEVLATGELVPTGRSNEEIWAELGLRREPQPLLISGAGTIELDGGCVPLLRPYLGLPPEPVRSVISYRVTS